MASGADTFQNQWKRLTSTIGSETVRRSHHFIYISSPRGPRATKSIPLSPVMEGVTKLFESIGAWADAHPTVIKDLPELLLAQVAGVGAVA